MTANDTYNFYLTSSEGLTNKLAEQQYTSMHYVLIACVHQTAGHLTETYLLHDEQDDQIHD